MAVIELIAPESNASHADRARAPADEAIRQAVMPSSRVPGLIKPSNPVVKLQTEVPPAIVAPSGLTGAAHDEYQPGSILDTATLKPNCVLLNVYDVGANDTVNRINEIFTGKGAILIAGIFHGGVEVYGKEWSFGYCDDGDTGVCRTRPRRHPQHTYKNTIVMGETSLTRAEVTALLERMKKEWPGKSYNLIHNNCVSFCSTFLQELGLRRVPGWVDRAARAASSVDTSVRTVISPVCTMVTAIHAQAVGRCSIKKLCLLGTGRRAPAIEIIEVDDEAENYEECLDFADWGVVH